VTLADGIHQVGRIGRVRCLELVRSTALAVHERGLRVEATDPADPPFLCLMAGPGSGRAVLVRRGQLRAVVAAPPGQEIEQAAAPTSVDEALAWLGLPG
jgi:hypothetical protein